MRYKTGLVFIILLVSSLSAQFGSVDVSVDMQRLKAGDRRITREIPRQLELFFTGTPWDKEYGDLQIPLTVQLIFEGVSEKGGERVYSARCLFSNRLDQRYLARVIQFPYSPGQSILYSPVIFDPVSSAMEFYALIILAGEADTYEPLGGTRFYERCRELALRGVQSLYPRGWGDRVELVDQLSKNRGLRLAKYYFYDAQALMEEGETGLAEEALAHMIEQLTQALTRLPREHYTMIFLDAHAQELSRLPGSVKNRKEILSSLIRLDPDRKEIYEAGLVGSSE